MLNLLINNFPNYSIPEPKFDIKADFHQNQYTASIVKSLHTYKKSSFTKSSNKSLLIRNPKVLIFR